VSSKSNLPETSLPRIVIVGAGFGGLALAQNLDTTQYQVVLIDKNNYHQFQPLFYQVATAGLEPSAITFPLRKLFQQKTVHFRMASLERVEADEKYLITNIGRINYDFLVIATGADNNFFGNQNLEKYSYGLKSISEALAIRNLILENFEKALSETDEELKKALLNITIVGGGPTGIEMAGAISEMRKYILEKDYPELDDQMMKIVLIDSSTKLVKSMQPFSSEKCEKYLTEMEVDIIFNDRVKDYDGYTYTLQSGATHHTKCLIWAAGIKPIKIEGLDEASWTNTGRINTDRFNKIITNQHIYAIGDIAYQTEEKYPEGYPQVAPVAMQQADHLAVNFNQNFFKKDPLPFVYIHKGSMATVGRNKAVAEFPNGWNIKGFWAWAVWLFVHLMSIIGSKNRVVIIFNWLWSYITYDQPLRLIIKGKQR
jgi:NADH:ubiquinone reductase (H+-translocating)